MDVTYIKESLNEDLQDIEALKNNYVASGLKVFKTTSSNFDNIYCLR